MKLTKLIYVASPYTAKKSKAKKVLQNMRYIRVTQVIGKLQDLFPYAFLGPITQSHNTVKYMKTKNTTFKNWAVRDYTYISRCDELWVITLPGWSESVGVSKEMRYAKSKKIPVRFVSAFFYDDDCALIVTNWN